MLCILVFMISSVIAAIAGHFIFTAIANYAHLLITTLFPAISEELEMTCGCMIFIGLAICITKIYDRVNASRNNTNKGPA